MVNLRREAPLENSALSDRCGHMEHYDMLMMIMMYVYSNKLKIEMSTMTMSCNVMQLQ